MNTMLQTFECVELGTIRTTILDGQVWFVAKDIAIALGHQNPERAVRKFVEDEDKGVTDMVTPGGAQKVTVINEPGMYALIFGSEVEPAKKFKHWVTHEVLPAIRQQGFYSMLTDEKLIEVLAERTKVNPDYLQLIDKTKIKKEALQGARDEKIEATRHVWFRRFTQHEDVNVQKELRRIWAGDMPMYHKYLDKFHADERKESRGEIITI